ncbi:MAG: hypothetical protein AAF602_01620 [Myxococcota bacterium]
MLVAILIGCSGSPEPYGVGTPLTVDEFEALVEDYDVLPADVVPAEQEWAELEARVGEADAVIDAFLEEHPELRAQLRPGEPTGPVLPDGTVRMPLPGTERSLVLHGPAVRTLEVAQGLREQDDPALLRRALADLLPVVPDHCRALGTSESAREALDLEGLRAERRAIGRCWDDWRTLVQPFAGDQRTPRGGAGPLAQGEDEGSCEPYPLGTGDGQDQWKASSCSPEDPWVAGWAHATHLSGLRNQAGRGTCVAFATASALEYTASRGAGRDLDVSEQYLYAVAKHDLFPNNYVDGLPTPLALDALQATQATIGMETIWGYNPSPCREELDTPPYYLQSCDDYGHPVCSDSVHQMRIVTGPDGESYRVRPKLGDLAVRVADRVPLFDILDPSGAFDSMAAYLDAGWGVVASIDVTEDFRQAGDDGFLPASDDTFVGTHAVHVLRWIPDAGAPGGGTVVLRNSWGCSWGDAGYGYVTAEWFRAHVNSLSAIRDDFVVRQNKAPDLSITAPATHVIEPLDPFGNDFVLQAEVSDREDGAACCEVSWWSSIDGDLGQGTQVELTVLSAGEQTVLATARDSHGAIAQDQVTITVTNAAPVPTIERPSWPVVRVDPTAPPPALLRLGHRVPAGVPIAFSGRAIDPNEFGTLPCETFRWFAKRVDIGLAGCSRTVALDPGWHRIRMTVADQDGGIGHTGRWVRAVDWTAFDRPFAQIVHPSHDGVVLDPFMPIELEVTAVSGLRGLPSVRWVVIDGDTEIAIGSGRTLSWTPADDLPVVSGGIVVQLRVEVTDGNGTATDRLISVGVGSPTP